MECCKNQYLVYGESGYLTCKNCGAEDTQDKMTEEEYEELFNKIDKNNNNWEPID